jgi:hypothetical protein
MRWQVAGVAPQTEVSEIEQQKQQLERSFRLPIPEEPPRYVSDPKPLPEEIRQGILDRCDGRLRSLLAGLRFYQHPQGDIELVASSLPQLMRLVKRQVALVRRIREQLQAQVTVSFRLEEAPPVERVEL